MSTSNGFAPQAEEMDLSALYAHTYVVAVSTGDRDDGRLLAKTMHGPYGFDEMVGEVGRMWTDSQDNAKVYVLEKDPLKKSKWLDSKTVDYIQDKYMDIIMARIIGNDEPKKYTVQAGIVEETQTEVSQEVPF